MHASKISIEKHWRDLILRCNFIKRGMSAKIELAIFDLV